MYASTRAVFERATSVFVQAASEWGLTVSIQKTKGMIIGRQLTASASMPVELDSGSIKDSAGFHVPRKQHHKQWQSTE